MDTELLWREVYYLLGLIPAAKRETPRVRRTAEEACKALDLPNPWGEVGHDDH